MADISVVGIGNIIMQDEGFGVRCAEYLQKITDYPDFVQIIDGGSSFLVESIRMVEKDV